MGHIEKKKLSDSIIEEIKNMVEKKELREGDKLPNQIEFARQLGVSRASLREALYTLSNIGVIVQRPGIGTVISSINPLLWSDQIYPPLVSDAKSTLQLIEARRFIEIAIVELAVKYATDEDVEKIWQLAEKLKQACKEKRSIEYGRFDMDFHHQIAKSSHNRFMIHMFATIRGLMEQFIKETFLVIPGEIERSLQFHVQISDAISKKDKRMAISSMKKHILSIERALREYYKSRNDSPPAERV